MISNALEVKDLTKIFNNSIKANEAINISFKEGTIHSICGENGAGKTTLISMLTGILKPTSGTILINNKETKIENYVHANKLGIALVPQHIELLDDMTVWENITIGNEITKNFMIDKNASIAKVNESIEKYGFTFKATDKIKKLSMSQRQKVQILKALYLESNIIIFDEPTSMLSTSEITELLNSLKQMKKAGKTIIYISHKLKEVLNVSDEISVLKRGKLITTMDANKATKEILADLIVGVKGGSIDFVNNNTPSDDVLLKVSNLGTFSSNNVSLKNINFNLHKGEIIGVLGVDGNGQDEFVKTILRRKKKINQETKVTLDGTDISNMSTIEILNNHISLVAENRHVDGLVLSETIFNNFFVSIIDRFTKYGFVLRKKQKTFVEESIKQFDIRGTENLKSAVSSMSGGNQQKIILARELSKGNKLLIVQKPTTGVDVGAIKNIYNNIYDYASKGNGVILISDEVEEVIQASHRLMVFYNGEIMGIVPKKTPLEILGRMMLGEKYADIKVRQIQ